VSAVGPVLGVQGETFLALSAVLKASSATPTIVPFQVAFVDANGNVMVTATPIASAAAPTSFTSYNALVGVPDGAVKATLTFSALTWGATGGFTVIVASPTVAGF
jgi:hypothetical protein